jgi:hypothetical protein
LGGGEAGGATKDENDPKKLHSKGILKIYSKGIKNMYSIGFSFGT